MEKIILQKWMDYSSDLHFIAGKITHDGTLLIIESSLTELDFFQRPVPKNNWTIRIIKDDTIETVELIGVPLVPTELDLFSDGTLLIVQGRCLKEGNYVERNARRYNPNGQLITAFTLGDGIESVQIDDTDTIWVSYFDEGIFGNFGWEKPIGSDGLLAFNQNGDKLWGAHDYGISDCYALNVASTNEVYFYYYHDFFLIKLSEMEESVRYRVEGNDTLNQFIFDQDGLIGQIDLYTLMRYRIRHQMLAPKEKIQLTDEYDNSIRGPIFMRGKYLYAYGKDGLYKRGV